ncbi:terpenoid cyclases protein prenyltransferase [Coniophora puteana RWD-64-598 SS2]|uniref:Protein farnesyltransferase subunit beta n=1 Tax=Coniophora puteana (strain RWD-64-598) TaxID=741705 RepID=A0A5M3MGA8_CONPW|nr:terpenoid cyclases protein prenyltransferase [Coniophora puteana RWD-64-598 SS2]EIW78087.1 terpenoid cyclases protein prenyltransferase [Coniophora puteana RWD-64-598 SS2]
MNPRAQTQRQMQMQIPFDFSLPPRPTPTDGVMTETSDTQAEMESVLQRYLPVGGGVLHTAPHAHGHGAGRGNLNGNGSAGAGAGGSGGGGGGGGGPGGSAGVGGAGGAPALQRNAHLQFLVRNLTQGFPERYVSQDASQPWLLFWTLQSFSVARVGLDPGNKQRAIDTILAWQHPDGGFGGGPGQAAHLLPTYAAVCALAIVGRPGPGGGWDQIDREKMYAFFMSLKQPDGSFTVSHHAEVDVRGTYCLLVVAHLLDLLTPALVRGTAAFVASCQTYEGGFASASQPYFAASTSGDGEPVLLEEPRPALGEAHGGYTFCALASWVMLRRFLPPEEPSSSSPVPPLSASSAPERRPQINYKSLTRWLAQLQGGEAELGGFRGRTNKLVDGCYSWWVGGCFALLEALGVGGGAAPASASSHVHAFHLHSGGGGDEEGDEEDGWKDVDDSLWNRAALQTYLLCAGQHPAGGLRDKPPKPADAYHTHYCLSGLSSAQHHVAPDAARREEVLAVWQGEAEEVLRRELYADTLAWAEEEGTAMVLGGSVNGVNATHPVFNLTMTHTEGIMGHFYKQVIPRRM